VTPFNPLSSSGRDCDKLVKQIQVQSIAKNVRVAVDGADEDDLNDDLKSPNNVARGVEERQRDRQLRELEEAKGADPDDDDGDVLMPAAPVPVADLEDAEELSAKLLAQQLDDTERAEENVQSLTAVLL
jgi:hypothetical protein